jgi:hypothetical protein
MMNPTLRVQARTRGQALTEFVAVTALFVLALLLPVLDGESAIEVCLGAVQGLHDALRVWVAIS